MVAASNSFLSIVAIFPGIVNNWIPYICIITDFVATVGDRYLWKWWSIQIICVTAIADGRKFTIDMGAKMR
jgi:hypothetical protein